MLPSCSRRRETSKHIFPDFFDFFFCAIFGTLIMLPQNNVIQKPLSLMGWGWAGPGPWMGPSWAGPGLSLGNWGPGHVAGAPELGPWALAGPPELGPLRRAKLVSAQRLSLAGPVAGLGLHGWGWAVKWLGWAGLRSLWAGLGGWAVLL
jgi:hypothetical protein